MLEGRVDRESPGLVPRQREAVVDMLLAQMTDSVAGWVDARGGSVKTDAGRYMDDQVAGGRQAAWLMVFQ